MSGEKLRVAKVAVEEAIARLQPDDRFSVVVYDDVVDVVIESTHASAEARRGAVERLRHDRGPRQHQPRRGLAAWLRAGRRPPRRERRQPLPAPDRRPGQRRDHRPGELASHAAELRARGVSTSTFGVGNDFDERLLQDIADAGGGHFYYIADAPQIRDAITSEVGETLEVVARDVDLEVTARDDVRSSRSARTRLTFAGTGRSSPSATSAPSRSSRSSCACPSRTATSDARRAPSSRSPIATASSAGGAGETEPLGSRGVRRRPANDAQPRDHEVDRAVARLFAARARQEAVHAIAPATIDGPRRSLDATAKRIRGYAGHDPGPAGLSTSSREEQARTPPRWPRHCASRRISPAPTCFAAATPRATRSSAADGPRLFALRTA